MAAELPISSSQAASRGGVAQALDAARSEERRLGAHASHAGAPAFLIGLEDTPELNGVRVKLEEPLFAAGAPHDNGTYTSGSIEMEDYCGDKGDFTVGLTCGDEDSEEWSVWAGEVMEVDEANGRLYVVVRDGLEPPCCGSFYVRPYEFLSFLNFVYNDEQFEEIRRHMPGRLAAARGGVHPAAAAGTSGGLPALRHCWEKYSHAWADCNRNFI